MSLRTRVALIMLVIAVAATAAVSALAVQITSSMLDRAADAVLIRVAGIQKLSQRLQLADSPRAARAVVPASVSVQQGSGAGATLLWGDQIVPVPASVTDNGKVRSVIFDTDANGNPYRAIAVTEPNGSMLVISVDMQVSQSVVADLVRKLLVVGVVVAAIAGVIGWFAASAVVRPLRRLTSVAEHVAATGDLEQKVRTSSADETGRLSRAFDDMLGALTISQDLQRQLVQDAGHELRTPITSVMSNAEVLGRHPDLDLETRDQICDDLLSESQELARLVDSLVALAGVMDDTEPVQAVGAAQLVAAVVHRLPESVAVRIAVSGDGIIAVRPGQAQRALINVLTNAAKFDPGSGPVAVMITSNGEQVAITVRDHGPGIAQNDLPKVFDRFYRAATAQLVPGSGLGLSIVADICRHNNGSVTLQNHPEGGAVAILTFSSPR